MTERKIFTSDEDFIICNISDEDRSDYVELHRQLNGEASLYLNPIVKDMMWKQILENADTVFSLFTGKGNYCGSIELQQPNSKTPEIVVESKGNNSELVKAVKALEDNENKYVIVFDNSFDNLQVVMEQKLLRKFAKAKNNVFLMDIYVLNTYYLSSKIW